MSIILYASLILQLTDFGRELAGGKASRSSVVTQGLAWVIGIVVIAIGANASVTEGLILPGVDVALGALDAGSIILVGLLASSLASTIVDVKAAIDNKDSSAKPPLLRNSPCVREI